MQVRRSFFLSCLFSLSLAAACSDSPSAGGGDDDDDGSGSSSGGEREGGASSSSSSSSGSSGGSSSSGSSSGGSDASTIPARPANCEPLPTTAFANGRGLTPSQYGAQPTLRSVVVTPLGEEVLGDLLHVRLDAATGLGSYELAPLDGDDNCYEDGAQCVYLHEDVYDGSSSRFYAAVRGRLRIDAQITTDQSQGVLEYVELREATLGNRNVPYNASSSVEQGRCYWIENAPFDSRRPNGCNPLAAGGCPTGTTCIADNAAGSDGTCRGHGNATNTASCSADTTGATTCGVEYACSIESNPADRKCRKRCDLLSADNACPTATVCSLFGYCEPQTVEPVGIGEECEQVFHFCGEEGARGLCFPELDGAGAPISSATCRRFERARSACAAGEDLGFIEFEGIADRSIGRCAPRQF